MTKSKFAASSILAAMIIIFAAGCTHTPGGVAASNVPINGRTYIDLGKTKACDSSISLLGILPITGSNSTADAIEEAIASRGGDAMVNLTVECYSQWWILFTRHTTRVVGNVIQFQE